MEDLQKLLPGFPRVTPQAPFLQVTPNVNFMQNVLPRQNLQPTGQLEYKVRAVPLSPLRPCPTTCVGCVLTLACSIYRFLDSISLRFTLLLSLLGVILVGHLKSS